MSEVKLRQYQKKIHIDFKKVVSRFLIYLLFICITGIVFLPIIITVVASVKTAAQLGSTSPLAFPSFSEATLENYKTIFNSGKLLIAVKNSVFLVVISVVLNAIIGSTTAYVLERFQFKLKALVYGMFLLGMLLPAYITEIARFQVMTKINMYNTLGAPILIYIATDLMQLYIYRQFVQKIPIALDESAMIDGAGHFTIFWRIIFPNLLPATATLAIIKSVDVLNDMYIPYLYMPSSKLRTLTTMLMDFSSSLTGSWQSLSAAIVIVMVPTILLFIFFQRYIFAGIVAGAV
ncbi:MAG: carbohydrate ABC transporter permease, partial [Vallitaleaceae bacterium]|nr:carbohydrate ABC transporter permease [Vallitaleaceae bacterium]